MPDRFQPEPLTGWEGAKPVGNVGGGRAYHPITGDLLPPWHCPACGSEQPGPLEQGCQACGSGKPGFKAAKAETVTSPVTPTPKPVVLATNVQSIYDLAARWATAHIDASLAEAFVAGALTQFDMAKPETESFAPTFNPASLKARTFIAALTYWRDQILVDATDEIESGEWGSIDDVNQWIRELGGQP